MSGNGIACGACGFGLGTGLPGASAWCGRCGKWVTAKAAQGKGGDVIGGIVALAAGLALAALLAAIFGLGSSNSLCTGSLVGTIESARSAGSYW